MQQIAEQIARWEWLILMAFLPLLLFATQTGGLVLLLFPLLAFVRYAAHGRFFPHTPLNLPLLLLLLMTLVSLLITFDVTTSLPLVSRIVVGVGLFWGCVSSVQEAETAVWRITTAVLLLGGGLTLLGVLTVPWRFLFSPLATLVGLLPAQLSSLLLGLVGETNPNIMAQTLLLVAPLLFGVAWWRPDGMEKSGRYRFVWPLLLLASVATLLLLVATRSRGGLLGLGVSLLLMLALGTRWGRWLLGTAVVVLPITMLAIEPVRSLILSSTSADFNLNTRLEIWSRALYALSDFPLSGLSLNGFSRVVHILYPLFTISPAQPVDHAHNHLLQAGLDLGLPGLIAYLTLWLLLAWLLWESWRIGKNGRYRPLLLGLIGSHAALWSFGLFDAAPWITLPGFLWWLLVGLSVALHWTLSHSD